jgi:hypothetical protein
VHDDAGRIDELSVATLDEEHARSHVASVKDIVAGGADARLQLSDEQQVEVSWTAREDAHLLDR